ncbi:MAG TPA: hypothetical protein VGL94_05140 [Ktedonobacteraceae bacterium]|jgi:hypothetical protein
MCEKLEDAQNSTSIITVCAYQPLPPEIMVELKRIQAEKHVDFHEAVKIYFAMEKEKKVIGEDSKSCVE